MNNIIRRVIERACALLPLQCVPGLFFARLSRCVREKYGAGDEASRSYDVAFKLKAHAAAVGGSRPLLLHLHRLFLRRFHMKLVVMRF